MATENVQKARELTAMWNEGVRKLPDGYLDPQIELQSPFSQLSGEPYRGHEGIERWMRDVDEQFSQWRIAVEDIQEVPGTVAFFGRLQGRGRGSGVELDQAFATVLDFTPAGLIRRVRIFWDLAAAREAAGLAG